MQADAIAPLVSVSLPGLAVLRFSHNRLDVDAAKLLATGTWPQLLQLTLDHNSLDTAAMAFLAKGNWPALSYLDLHDNSIGTLGLELVMAGQWPQLRHLSLDSGSVTEANCRLLKLAPSEVPSSMDKFGSFAVSRQLTAREYIWPKLLAVEFKHTPKCAAATSVYQEQGNRVAVKSVGTNTELLTRLGGSTTARVSGYGGQVAKTSCLATSTLDKSRPTWIEVVGWCTIVCVSICLVQEACCYTCSK